MAITKISSIQFKRGTCAALTAKLTSKALGVLLEGEPALETDTFKLKVGDGVKDYADLPYVSGGGGTDQRFIITDPIQNQVLLYDEEKQA